MKTKIYIIHGWAYNTEKWDSFLDLLSKRSIEPILLQVPGLTDSLDAVWTLDNYVDWLHTHLKGEKHPVVLLGHSNGGRISIAYTLKYPEKVKQLVLIDSAGIYHNELPIRLKRIVFKMVAKLGKKVSNSEKMRKLLYRLVREKDYKDANPIIRRTMRNLIEVDLSPQLNKIKIPTLIIWGERDKVTPLIDAKAMHDKIAQSTLHVIPAARHSPQFTHAEQVAEIISMSLQTYDAISK